MRAIRDELRLLAPRSAKSPLDGLERIVQRATGGRFTRGEALGLAGAAGFAAVGAVRAPVGDIEDQLVIYNWSEYDNPKSYRRGRRPTPARSSRRRTTRRTTSCSPS